MQLTVVDTPEGDFTFTYVLNQVKSTRVKYPDIYVIAEYKYVHIVNQDEINNILYKEKIKKFTLIQWYFRKDESYVNFCKKGEI